jgi:4-amino-4-deoxy-L-arabinose transferase-like glycosyltransferase
MHMKTSALIARLLSCAILLFAFGVSVYRAKTQAIAHDEALTYQWFLDQGVYHVLMYNPANHVLFTILAKPFVWVLGVKEFTLRAPSLFGAAAYLMATYFLCAKLFGDGLLLPLSVALLCLNPQILDFLPAARGYSLGLACLAATLYILAKLVERGEFDPDDKGWRWGCAMASVLLALSLAASLTNIVPAACLTLAFAIVALGGRSAFKEPGNRRLRIFSCYLLVPGVFAGLGILWPFLIQVRRAHAETNMGGTRDAVREIFNGSFLYKWTDDVYSSLGAIPPMPHSWQAQISDLGGYVILPLLFCFVAFGLVLASRPGAGPKTNHDRQRQLFAGAAVACVALIFLLHVAAKINYPFSRYCLFFIPLFTIGAVLTGREIDRRFPRARLKIAGVIIAGIVVFDYAVSLNTAYFRYTAYDMISRELFQTIAKDAQPRGLTNVRVGGTWWYEPEMNFYRRRYRADWLLPYDIKDRSYIWETPNSLVPADYDYFVFIPASDPGLKGPRVRTIFHDDKTQVTIIALARQ